MERGKDAMKKGSKLLSDYYPDLVNEWHPTKNGNLTPDQISTGSNREIWWKCQKGHEYELAVKRRTSRHQGCPRCYTRKSVPELYVLHELEWIFREVISDFPVENYHIDIFLPNYDLGIEYDGYIFHRHRVRQDSQKNKAVKKQQFELIRIRESGLAPLSKNDVVLDKSDSHQDAVHALLYRIMKILGSFKEKKLIQDYLIQGKQRNPSNFRRSIANRKIPSNRSLSAMNTDADAAWDYKKNKPLTPNNVNHGTHEYYYFKCLEDASHPSYKTQVKNFYNGTRCPICAGKRTLKKDSLLELRPDIASEWDYEWNGEKTPENYSVNSEILVSWKCERGHRWQQTIAHRTKRTNPTCNVCLSVGQNYPELVAEFDQNINPGIDLYKLTPGSGKSITWKCSINPKHIWQARIYTRTKKKNPSGCPHCYRENRSK